MSMSMKETIARAIVRRLTDKLWTKSGPELFTRYGVSSADDFFEHAWKTDYNLLRGRALADVDEMCEVLLKPTEAILKAGDGPGAMCRMDAEGAFIDMITAIKDGK